VFSNSAGLLEHFARLATNVTGTKAAVVGVLGQRRGREPRRVAYGLTSDELHAFHKIEPALDAGTDLTVIPDLARDHRFDRFAGFAEPRHHFAVHLKLVSPGGEAAGFLCLLDEAVRPGLSDAEIVSLRHIASMIMADRQREQRHLHLMHVADRALRVDRMLRLVSDAASCADALTNLLGALCQDHGAAIGQIWQLVGLGKPLVEISRYQRNDEAADDFLSLNAVHEMTADAIRTNKPHAIKFSQIDGFGMDGDAEAHAFSSQVCIPIWVRQQRFGISLMFDADDNELDKVMADIASLGDTIRPALFQKVTEERMRFAAHHDDLTQLSNRLMFQERLRKAIAEARSADKKFAVLCLDLDGFKQINDTRGHEIGDRLLVGVAQRLRESVRETDTVARMGGDEFAIIQPIDSQPAAAIGLAKRLVETVSRPFELAGRAAAIGVSVGIALYPHHGESADLLLRHADQALYWAKKAGRKTFRVFDPELTTDEQSPLLAEKDLRDAIGREDFSLAYQPVCDSLSRDIIGFEALLRWRHPSIGLIAPDEFIPLAEKSGLIVPLGRWALEQACAEAASWDPPVMLSVNLSPLQFRQPELPREIADVLTRTNLPASRLRLEVTEGLLLDDTGHVLRTMRGLQEQGIRMILDDFGTAYASMSYLRRFPFNGIKIDKSFVRGLCNDEVTLAIVEAILSLGDRLNLAVVAEGVETERELDVLRGLGCRFFQGFLGGRPAEGRLAHSLLRKAG
jgi:diguanylate cyclase (GGDEF)-like protein